MDWRCCDRCGVPREFTYQVCDETVCHECSSPYEEREPFLDFYDAEIEASDEDRDTLTYADYLGAVIALEDFATQEGRKKG